MLDQPYAAFLQAIADLIWSLPQIYCLVPTPRAGLGTRLIRPRDEITSYNKQGQEDVQARSILQTSPLYPDGHSALCLRCSREMLSTWDDS